jgi:hypothetical protein
MTRPRWLWLVAVAIAVAPQRAGTQAPGDAAAQRPRIVLHGVVKDPAGAPVQGATIVAHGLSLGVTSNDSGLFSFGPFPSGMRRFEIRRLGYQPIVFDVDVPMVGPHELDIELSPIATELESVEVRKAATVDLSTTGFFNRKTRYAGAVFIGPEEIDKRHASFASQVLESAPNVVLRGVVGRKRVLLHNGCDVAIFVDRRFVRSGRDRRNIEWGYLDDLVDGQDVYAVEIYTQPPPEFTAPAFANQRFCGALVIWTRLYRPNR